MGTSGAAAGDEHSFLGRGSPWIDRIAGTDAHVHSAQANFEQILLQERRQHAEQGAKALAILEVKDGVIAQLEQELRGAREWHGQAEANEASTKAAAAKNLKFSEEWAASRLAKAEEEARSFRARFEGAERSGQQLRQELELFRRAKAAAESEATTLGIELQTLKTQLVAAEGRADSAERELPRLMQANSDAISAAQRARSAAEDAELRLRRFEVQRDEAIALAATAARDAAAAGSRPPEEVLQLENALVQCQADLVRVERELHVQRQQGHVAEECNGEAIVGAGAAVAAVSSAAEVAVMRHELNTSRRALSKAEGLEEAARAKAQHEVGILEQEVHDLRCASSALQDTAARRTAQSPFDEELQQHAAAFNSLCDTLRAEVAHSIVVAVNRAEEGNVDVAYFRAQVQSLQEHVQHAEAAELAASNQLRHGIDLHAEATSRNACVRRELEVRLEEFAERLQIACRENVSCEAKASQASEEHKLEIQQLEAQLKERQEQLRTTCRSLETQSAGVGQRVGELTGRLLVLQRTENARRRRLIHVEHEAERAAAWRTELESERELVRSKATQAQLRESLLEARVARLSDDLDAAGQQLHRTIASHSSLEAQLADARRTASQCTRDDGVWRAHLEELHQSHLEQLARERLASDGYAEKLRAQIDEGPATPESSALLGELRDLLTEGGTQRISRRGQHPPSEFPRRAVMDFVSSLFSKLLQVEKRLVLSQVAGERWRMQAYTSTEKEAVQLKELLLGKQEALSLRRGSMAETVMNSAQSSIVLALQQQAEEARRKSSAIQLRCGESETIVEQMSAQLGTLRAKASELEDRLRISTTEAEAQRRNAVQTAEESVLARQLRWRDELIEHSLVVTDRCSDAAAARELGLELAIRELGSRLEDVQLRADALAIQNVSLRAKVDSLSSQDGQLPHEQIGAFKALHSSSCSAALDASVGQLSCQPDTAVEIVRLRAELAASRTELAAERARCQDLAHDLKRLAALPVPHGAESPKPTHRGDATSSETKRLCTVACQTEAPQTAIEGGSGDSVPSAMEAIMERLSNLCDNWSANRAAGEQGQLGGHTQTDELVLLPTQSSESSARRQRTNTFRPRPSSVPGETGRNSASRSGHERNAVAPSAPADTVEQQSSSASSAMNDSSGDWASMAVATRGASAETSNQRLSPIGRSSRGTQHLVLAELQRIAGLCERVHQELQRRPAPGQRDSPSTQRDVRALARAPRAVGASTRPSLSRQDSQGARVGDRPLSQAVPSASPPQHRQLHASDSAASTGATPESNTLRPAFAERRAIGVLTDPEVRHSAVQTVPLQSDAELQAAARSQAALMQRVESVIQMQRGLQTTYRCAEKELAEIREDREAHMSRAAALQDELATCDRELAAVSITAESETEASAKLRETEQQGTRWAAQEAEALENAEAIVAEAKGAANASEERLAEAMGQWQSEVVRSEAQEKDVAMRLQVEIGNLTDEISAVRDDLRVRELGWHSELVSAESKYAEIEESALKAGCELQDRCEALVLANEAVREAQYRAIANQDALSVTSAELIEAQTALVATQAEARCERAEAVLAGTEMCAQRALVDELREAVVVKEDLQLRLEAMEAGELWLEIARKEDRDEWFGECRALQARADSAASEAASLKVNLAEELSEGHKYLAAESRETRHHMAAALASAQKCQELESMTQTLQAEASELSQQVHDAHQQLQVKSREWSAECGDAQRGELLMQRELVAARGREAALLQELDRLREATLSSFSCPSSTKAVGSHNRGVSASAAGETSENDMVAVALPTQSESEAGKPAVARHDRRGGTQKGDQLRRLQQLLAQEKEHREQLRARLATADKEAAQARARVRELETQLRLCKDESERRRHVITTLQHRVAAADSANKEEHGFMQESEEATRKLKIVQRDLTRKDAAIQELRQDISHLRHANEEHRQREQVGVARAESDAARIRALRAEAQRKAVRPSVAAESHGRRSNEACGWEASESRTCTSEQQRVESGLVSASSSAPRRIPAVEEPGPPSPAQSLPSSIDASALEDSIKILNLRPEDLTEFLLLSASGDAQSATASTDMDAIDFTVAR